MGNSPNFEYPNGPVGLLGDDGGLPSPKGKTPAEYFCLSREDEEKYAFFLEQFRRCCGLSFCTESRRPAIGVLFQMQFVAFAYRANGDVFGTIGRHRNLFGDSCKIGLVQACGRKCIVANDCGEFWRLNLAYPKLWNHFGYGANGFQIDSWDEEPDREADFGSITDFFKSQWKLEADKSLLEPMLRLANRERDVF